MNLMPYQRGLPAHLIAGAFAFLASGTAWSAPLPKGVTLGPSVEGITEYRLANGLKVLLFPDASRPTVTVNVTYLVGSRHENYGETGMAHLLEHLMFKGARKNRDITRQFADRGMDFNGTTSLDRTNYYEVFQASKDNLDWALQMEADRMTGSFIAQKDLDSEMTVVRNEYESGENSPSGVLVKRMQSVAYDWHSYGRSTIGNRSDIENVRIANLQAFYRTYYQPDNAVLLVAGNGHVQRGLGVPQHLPAGFESKVLSVQARQAQAAMNTEASDTPRRAGADLVWSTPALPPRDHCAAFRPAAAPR